MPHFYTLDELESLLQSLRMELEVAPTDHKAHRDLFSRIIREAERGLEQPDPNDYVDVDDPTFGITRRLRDYRTLDIDWESVSCRLLKSDRVENGKVLWVWVRSLNWDSVDRRRCSSRIATSHRPYVGALAKW